MRTASLRALFVAAALLCVNAETFAAGLGRLEVLTALGTPLRAEIVVIADKNEIPSLSAKIAPPVAFQNAGLIYSPVIGEMRVAIEKRANGEPYLSVTTKQPLNEPVLDLLIELSWASGRVTREYTAFVDPPLLIAEREKQRAAAAEAKPTTRAAPPQPAPKPEPLPEAAPAKKPDTPIPTTPTDIDTAPVATAGRAAPVKPAPAPKEPPVQTIGGTAPTLLGAEDASSMPKADGEKFGPTIRGDTLSKIALATKPREVTLEQMLVLLFRSNPDAFSGKNMNRLKTGKIIRLPDASDYGSIGAPEARKEVRLQSANWKAYRERVAARAAQETPTAAGAQQFATGQVTPKVEDKAAPSVQPKEVVKLSKGEPGAATPGAAGPERGKALEEELTARNKALAEANERVAKLEKTIKDLQALVDVKSQNMAELQRQAAAAAPAKPAPPPARAAAPATPAAKPPATAPAQPTVRPGPPPGQHAPALQAGPPAGQQAPKPAQPATPPVSPAPQAAAPPPTPAPAQQARPKRALLPPPPEPSMLDKALGQPMYLAAGALVVAVVGLLAVRTARRRRETKAKTEEVAPATAIFGAPGAGRGFAATETDVGLAARNRDIAEEVDPLEEAEIFLAYGRDAQAEELLKEAIAANPRRYEIHIKLLEVYARRNDVKAFEQVAREVQQGTGGHGELWDRVVGLGYQVDPHNPRYAAGRSAAESSEPSSERLDLNVALGEQAESTVTDIDLGDTTQVERTHTISPEQFDVGEATEPASTSVDLHIDLPTDAAEPGPPSSNAIDFDFDIGKISPREPAPAAASAPSGGAADAGLNFDMGSMSMDTGEDRPSSAPPMPSIDLSGISLDMEGAPSSSTTSTIGKDEKWYEVQTKFDLAKAYQEMGDKDGAREILKEVIAEGDAEQKAAAQAVLALLE